MTHARAAPCRTRGAVAAPCSLKPGRSQLGRSTINRRTVRIWVTGIGVVSPLARTAGGTMDRLLRGDRAFRKLTLFELPDARSSIAAEIDGLSPEEVAPPGKAEGWSRTDTMAVHAAREALAQAGLAPGRTPVDLVVGGTTAGMFETEHLLASLSNDEASIRPLDRMISHPLSAPADHVSAAAGPFRRVRTVCSACSSGASAILLGAAWIRLGRSDRVLAGGADGLCRLTYSGFAALGALDPSPCRPFDRGRMGLSLGEAAAFLVLESEASARARGAVPLAELRGWAIGSEGHHITNPERDGRTAARVMAAALARGGLSPDQVDYVNAHGTATPLNDVMESAALRACFGERAARVPVSTVKGQIGHTLGAAGALEAAMTVLAIARGEIPPTVGLEEVDPECALDHVRTARRLVIRAAVSNSFGFGGMDAVLAFTAPGAFPPPPALSPRDVVLTGAATVGPLGVQASEGSAAYLAEGPAPDAGRIPFHAADHLDLGRARRIDRAGRFATAAMRCALGDASQAPRDSSAATSGGGAGAAQDGGGPGAAQDGGGPGATHDGGEAGARRDSAGAAQGGGDALVIALPERVGAIFGASFGNVDASTAYMKRIHQKGAKYASPAEFPNLLPSSPVGHASIYLGLRGAAFAVSDLNVTAESAMTTAIELVAAGEADVLAAGSVEETSPMIERCLGPVCEEITSRGPRSEGASAGVFEAAAAARARGARILARVAWWTSWRDPEAAPLAGVPAPPEGALVLAGRLPAQAAELLRGTPWEAVPVRALAPRTGDHEGAGGFAVVAGAALVARGPTPAVLVVGCALGRGYALLLAAPEAA